ncbi:MAG: His/Gly/Thr/Pro-type tRNA ligase C-terminal domain-containing protein [Pseudomonadota bacterium]|nr:His/Gly/Thr/Pro-type tRNA ligase C-terminal domain-containing protein [Pseudomonadota bacterium]
MQFADAELIGIPHRVVISEKGINNNHIEYRHRTNEDSKIISTEELFDLLKNK